MSSYPSSIRRCQHIKVNGVQCGSPALRDHRHCYFHDHARARMLRMTSISAEREPVTLPILEDANSIQMALSQVMQLLVSGQIEHKTAALLLYAMQTASANLKHTSFEPEPTHVVIDRESTEQRPIGTTAWSKIEGEQYDEVDLTAAVNHANRGHRNCAHRNCRGECEFSPDDSKFARDYFRLLSACEKVPAYRDRRISAREWKELWQSASAETEVKS
jgi:hypothetical protein